jgi:hypothetical protein
MDNSVSLLVEEVTASLDQSVINVLKVEQDCKANSGEEAESCIASVADAAKLGKEALGLLRGVSLAETIELGDLYAVKACTATVRSSTDRVKGGLVNCMQTEAHLEASEAVAQVEVKAAEWRLQAVQSRERLRKHYSDRLKQICSS